MQDELFWTLEDVLNNNSYDERITTLTAYKTSSDALVAEIGAGETNFAQQFQEKNILKKYQEEFFGGFNQNRNRRLRQSSVSLMDKHSQMATSAIAYFTFLKSQHGQWGYDEEDNLAFEEQEVADLFNTHFDTVVAHEEELVAAANHHLALMNQRAQAKR